MQGGLGRDSHLVMLTVICQLPDHMLGHCIQQGLRGPKEGLP